jgi:hypothetical protein
MKAIGQIVKRYSKKVLRDHIISVVTQKPTVFLSFSNVNNGKQKINKCKDLKIN